MKAISKLLTVGFAAATSMLAVASLSEAQPSTPAGSRPPLGRVIINSVSTPVFFNDGDTFRPFNGPLNQRPNRLAGFNTLESYGPVHRWGGWTYKEMYVNAKMAALNARRGVWRCEADPNDKDGYGRVLAVCKDLGRDHIAKGLAHALSIDGPADWDYIQIQRRAIVQRKGMWAKGVPPVVLTSLHSANERFDNSNNYNRTVSSLDGYSGDLYKWRHQMNFDECQEVCHPGKVLERDTALEVVKKLRDDDVAKPIVAGYEDVYLHYLLNEFATTGRVAEVFKKDGAKKLKPVLEKLQKAGAFGQLKQEGACMRYAKFERWFSVPPKPKCLKWSQ